MSAKQAAELLGAERSLRTREGLHVHVVITDVREVFGRVDAQVTPVSGNGLAWVAMDRLVGTPTKGD